MAATDYHYSRRRSRSPPDYRPSSHRHRSRSPPREKVRDKSGAWTPPPTRRERAHASGWDIAADGTKVPQQVAAAELLRDPNMNLERMAMLGVGTVYNPPVNALGQPIIVGQPSMTVPGSGPRADRQMRRLYAGNLPHTTEADLMHFFNVAMRTALGIAIASFVVIRALLLTFNVRQSISPAVILSCRCT